jgi:hypothetical protein
MSITSVAVGKIIAESARSGLVASSDAASLNDSRLARFIQAYAPVAAVGWFENRRLRVRQIKAQEQLFTDMCSAIESSHKKRSAKWATSAKRLQDPLVLAALAEMAGDIRVLNTLRLAVSKCPDTKLYVSDASQIESPQDDATQALPNHVEDVSWWDTLEALARRRNEHWRTDLLARAIVEYDREPGCIRLKSIWEIGMMEANDFGLLAAFCDSSLILDGKAVVLLEPADQAQFQIEAGDGIRQVNLAHAITALVGAGLVTQSRIQFCTDELVLLEHLQGPTVFNHLSPAREKGVESGIQVDAFSAGDTAMDICRLYQPVHNIASDANFELFRDLMTQEAEDRPEIMGKVTFSRADSSRAA